MPKPSLDERIGPQAGTVVPFGPTDNSFGIGTANLLRPFFATGSAPGDSRGDSRFYGKQNAAVYIADIENIRIQVVNETAISIDRCDVQVTNGNPDDPDALWVTIGDANPAIGQLGPIANNAEVDRVYQNFGWKWARLFGHSSAGAPPAAQATCKIRWSGQ